MGGLNRRVTDDYRVRYLPHLSAIRLVVIGGAFLAFSEEGLAFDKRVKDSERLAVAYLKSSSTTLSGKQD
ncbi:hypothetical protein HYC85_016599 [Camellia sinensis]|uniref:Uncharacterized protein n=1 Tax=Camellia sinensis TaxID=4442 RepID=A0A7J7H2C5_CAMSI|nr:hypothetical protein HYC85_016599 [Camellia sinensis]